MGEHLRTSACTILACHRRLVVLELLPALPAPLAASCQPWPCRFWSNNVRSYIWDLTFGPQVLQFGTQKNVRSYILKGWAHSNGPLNGTHRHGLTPISGFFDTLLEMDYCIFSLFKAMAVGGCSGAGRGSREAHNPEKPVAPTPGRAL